MHYGPSLLDGVLSGQAPGEGVGAGDLKIRIRSLGDKEQFEDKNMEKESPT